MKKPNSFQFIVATVCFLVCTGHTLKIMKPVYQKQPQGMVYIPTGKYVSESRKKTNIHALWMQESEVTNKQYWEYLNELRDSNLMDSFHKVYPDTAKMNSEYWISDYFNYFENELFTDFPVVGLTIDDMNGYAAWLTEKLQKENPLFSMECRLPTIEEWKFAASGGRGFNNYAHQYSITTNSLGNHLFHFFYGDFRYEVYQNALSCQLDYYDESETNYDFSYERYYLQLTTKDFKKIKTKDLLSHTVRRGFPTRSSSFFPNDYGLYSTAGNVAEMVINNEGQKIVVGGSYKTGPAYCRIHYSKAYPFDQSISQVDVGFRLVCDYQGPIKR